MASAQQTVPVQQTVPAQQSMPVQEVSLTQEQASGFGRYDQQVTQLVEEMTLAEKVGQMTQAELSFIRDFDEIHELSLGSILSGGNSDPKEGNSREAWANTYTTCQMSAKKTRHQIPLLYGVDAVHGHSNVLDAVIFPHNIGLGCANDIVLTEKIGRATALEVLATGIEWTFAPCVTVPRDDRWGRTYEGYSEDPERVAGLGAAMVRGLQQGDLDNPTSVLACIKHWVGDGGTMAEVRDSPFHEDKVLSLDQGDTKCSEEELRTVHVAPYLPSLEAGAGSVMVSYSSWNGQKCTSSKWLINDLLKEELGFDGFVISDYNAIDQCDPDYKTAIGLSINAGIDMAMVAERHRQFVKCLIELVEEGTVPMSRIDDAVTRILRVKAAMGLLDAPDSRFQGPFNNESFGSEEHRQLAREAVQKSLVVLKNEQVLPLSKSLRCMHVVGKAADDMGIQCGGWTIDWQGKEGDVTTGGTTLLAGIKEVANQIEVHHTEANADTTHAEAVVVVIGEPPYAEGVGDRDSLAIPEADKQMILELGKNDKPVVLVILSGRPMELSDQIIESCDAIVAAWLPGTEGAGVADVLFGDVAATGTLSYTWPKTTNQHPINVGDKSYEPLYPFGYGLKTHAVQIKHTNASTTSTR